MKAEFEKGHRVCCISDSANVGTVVTVIEDTRRKGVFWRVLVDFDNGEREALREHQITHIPSTRDEGNMP